MNAPATPPVATGNPDSPVVPVERLRGKALLPVGTRVRTYGQQYPRAVQDGTAVMGLVWDRGRGWDFVEYLFYWDEEGREPSWINSTGTIRVPLPGEPDYW